MTVGYIVLWLIVIVAATVAGERGGVLLILSRAIDNTRAAVRCAGMSLGAARGEWRRNWESCQCWARRER
jgi:hypothetical protein